LDGPPPLAAIRKPRVIEDPLNVYVDRPLGYLIVRLVYRTRTTPDHLTYLAAGFGMAAAAAWLIDGSSRMMITGAVLLWVSGILDGADGLLARARSTSSHYGRALDGVLDTAVALATVGAALGHLWRGGHETLVVAVGVPVVVLTGVQVFLYDFYQESYVWMTTPGHAGLPDAAEVEAWAARLAQGHAPAWPRIVVGTLRTLKHGQNAVVALTNPAAQREGRHVAIDERVASLYRRHNSGPMRLWIWLSLGPHTYLMAACGALDRFEWYLWVRAVPLNLLWLLVMVWQRRASARTEAALHPAR
jgi:hypothetical protein